MEFSEDDKKKLSKLGVTTRIVANAVLDGLNMLINGKCSDEDLTNLATKAENVSKGYFMKEDFVSFEECMRILSFGQNRVGCLKFLNENGLKCEKINNKPIGYRKDKVLELKRKYIDDVEKREDKKRRLQMLYPSKYGKGVD